MAETVTYTVQRGSVKRWVLYAPLSAGADFTGWSAISKLRPENSRNSAIDPSSAVAATLTTAHFGGDSERGPGWLFTLTAADCNNLTPGYYVGDAKVTQPDGDVIITRSWRVRVIEPASRI